MASGFGLQFGMALARCINRRIEEEVNRHVLINNKGP